MWQMYHILLSSVFAISSSMLVMLSVYVSQLSAKGCYGGLYLHNSTSRPTDEDHQFTQPFMITEVMFIGEFLCLPYYQFVTFVYAKLGVDMKSVPRPFQGGHDFTPLIFYLPAMCDMVATTVTIIGLLMTYSYTFHILRSITTLCTGLFSLICLNRNMPAYKWVGMVIILFGLATVGLADVDLYEKRHSILDLIVGNLMIISAQVLYASQFVLEEKILVKYNVAPVQSVGYEGLYGMCTLGTLLVPLYLFNRRAVPLADTIDAICQLVYNPKISASLVGLAILSGFGNASGHAVIKELNATTRMCLDSFRVVIIWIVSMISSVQTIHPIQILGFFIMSIGLSTIIC